MLMFTSLFTIAVVVIIFTWLRKRKLHMLLDKIPGPKAIPIFGNALSLEKDSAAFYLQLETLCFKHADTGVCRIWLGSHLLILVYRADHLEVFFKGSKHMTKSSIYDFLQPWLKKGLLTSTGEKWFKRRKMITPSFHFKILEEFLEVMNEQVQILVDLFERKVGNEPFDVQPYLAHYALDIICETAMGRHVNAQQDTESAYVKALHSLSKYTVKRFKEPWLWPEFIFRCHPAGREYFKSLKVLHGFTRQVIDERSAEFDRIWAKHQSGKNAVSGEDEETEGGIPIRIGKRMAFLDMLLWTAKKDESLTKDGIQEEVDTFMFEGHDTTAATTVWVFYVIGKHPEIQAKLHDEVDRIFGNDDRPATMEDLNQLKYLECVFKESMRLFTTVPFIGREVGEDINLDSCCLKMERYMISGSLVLCLFAVLQTETHVVVSSDDALEGIQHVLRYSDPPHKMDVEKSGCSCVDNDCACCLDLSIPQIKFKDWTCINFTSMDHEYYGIQVTLAIDSVVLFDMKIQAKEKNPRPICFGIPHFEELASFCIDFYDLDVTNETCFSGCLKLQIRLIDVTDFTENFGCFHIPLLDKYVSAQANFVVGLKSTERSRQLAKSGGE